MAGTAFAALVSLHNTLHFIDDHPRHCFYFEKEQIDALMESVLFLIVFMQGSDTFHGAKKDAARALDGRIARVAQAAEDVIESHVVDQIRSGSTLGGCRSSFLFHKQIIERSLLALEILHKLDYGSTADEPELHEIMDGLSINGKEFDRFLRQVGGNKRFIFLLDLQKAIEDMNYIRRKASMLWQIEFEGEEPTFPATTSSASEKNIMVGFDEELHRLLNLLTEESSSRQVISIVGIGGAGKTTLASNAFEYPDIESHFDVRLWVTVSQEFSVTKLLHALLSQMNKENSPPYKKQITSPSSVAELGEKLHKNLYGRRYLIILDDMWSVEAWDELNSFFPYTSGSCILVTTRQFDVASYLGNRGLYVRPLDEDNSWNLFCRKAFKDDETCPPELEDIGKKIVAMCKGLPLAIAVIGGHLRQSMRTTEYWENVANNMISVLNSGESEECLNILSLSYSYLPVRLKPLFLSLGVILEDEEIPMSDIVNLWIGEGFLHHFEKLTPKQVIVFSLEGLHFKKFTPKQVAVFSLEELRQRNLVSRYSMISNDGRVTIFYRIHGLLRELCLKIAKEEGFFSVLDTRQTINKERRVLIKGEVREVNHQPQIQDAPRSAALLRSLICEGGRLSFEPKLLRVLNKVDTTSDPKIDIDHVNLRYLKVDVQDKSSRPISISSSISRLWNLQTMIISKARGSIIAPYEIWEMPQLVHVEVDQLCLPYPLPVDSSETDDDFILENLHTLFKVENFTLSEEVCRRIPNVNELKLSYTGEPSLDYCPHNLGCFQKLTFLECFFDGDAKWHEFASNLTFPNLLRHLRLGGCCLNWEEVTVKIGSLPYLQILELFPDAATGSEWSPAEGGFPSLRRLFIHHCDLMYWNVDSVHFPVLEEVQLWSLSKLDEFPSGIGDIPTLSKILLAYCSMSSNISAMRMMMEQQELENTELQLFVYVEVDGKTLEDFRQTVEKEGLRGDNIHLNV